MKRVVLAVAAMALSAAAVTAGAGSAQDSKEVRAEGCVEPGVENQCLVVKDVKNGKLYNVFIKEPRPAIGDGIEFTGVLYDGVTYCMQGTPVQVTSWARKDSLKCKQGEAAKY
ncbi:MAG: hypothetical protein ABSC47_03055 [Terracidiphilus sp.]|jgi:hypothetical protein